MNKAQLNWDSVNWSEFQTLTKYFAEELFPYCHFSEYLKPGHAQGGIDLLHFSQDTGTHICVQCKKVNDITLGEFEKIIEEFTSGSFYKTTSKFILCTSVDFQYPKFQKLVQKAQTAFRAENIEFQCWDINFLNDNLRNHYSLVSFFFGNQSAEDYCFKRDYKNRISKNKLPENYINRDVVEFRHPESS